MASTTSPSLPLLRPVLGLVGWTFAMEAWMYQTRIPAINRYNVQVRPEGTVADMNAKLPAVVRWKADNYNHLHEAPLRFYVVALTHSLLFLLQQQQQSGAFATKDFFSSSEQSMDTELALAWMYVGLRVVHSLVQALTNRVMVRFGVYLASEVVMLGLFIRVVSYALV
ncbi:hypothetical protein AAFC00_003388 [Neodothiora populina]|uniref:Uncharacterized protein n=1 Tax=Neodothiora populina TaxID=2781224 RepID=A0ABR3PEK2_9PEZI